jgi:diguanylate cyclase (GGDEF)-like protein
VRNASVCAAGDGILVIDDRGQVLDANAAARMLLRLPATPSRRGTPPLAPKAIQGLLEDASQRRARLKSPSGQFFEAWTTDAEPRGPLKGVRGVLIRDITTRHTDERKLVHLAHYDSLTGLANRRLFLELLGQAVETAKLEGERVALFYIDLDNFKTINDSLGHGAGDALLQTVGERFRAHLRPEDLAQFGLPTDVRVGIARLAGDEFAIIAPKVRDAKTMAELASWILELIAKPMILADRTLTSSGSAGIALYPDDGQDVETLIRHADAALYVAKSRGRRRYARFESSFEAKADRARLIEDGLRGAIEREELSVHYQPKVDLASGTVAGFEALLRWSNPALGDIGPAEFIPVAESRGLISTLGSWCLDETCRQLRSWHDAGLALVPISVNVSSVQFTETDLQKVVSEALKKHRIDPQLLELELTESLLLDEGETTELCLRDLRAIGIRIALDDFGTGYSALTYLNRFNLDVLKIDRALLRDIDSNSSAAGIASAVVSMAHSLGLTVVAEGIDIEAQLEPLRMMKCDQIQGFLYAPALPADDARRFLPRVGGNPPIARPNAAPPARAETTRGTETSNSADESLPVLKEADARPASAEFEVDDAMPAASESLRVLLVDDGTGGLGPLALRLGRLGIDLHYASAPDEAHLFIAQEKDAIRLLAVSPDFDLAELDKIRDSLARTIGSRPPFVVLGEEPGEERQATIRDAGATHVLWAPFNDAELRYLVKCAVALPREASQRLQPRLPVDLVANLRTGDRREVAVISSLSTRGAFIEMSAPLAVGSQFQVEFDLSAARFRGFARVVHQQAEDPEQPSWVSGIGVVFFGLDREMTRILLEAVQEREARYCP